MSKFESLTKPLMWFMALLLAAFMAGCSGGHPVLGGPNLSGLVSISVTPATSSIPKTGDKQFTATATYSDGSTRDVTASSTWASGTPSIATVGPNTGLATGQSFGTATITATYVVGTITASNTASLTVNTATPVSLKVTPTTASIPVGGTQKFSVIQSFTDGTTIDRTTTSAWASSGGSAANATVGAATGLATGVTVTPTGTPVIINATYGSLVATPATLIVTAATSVSFVVKPTAASISIQIGGTQQFVAIQTFSDGTTIDRTTTSVWTTSGSSAADATVGAGLATGVTVTPTGNPVIINATYNGLPATPASLTVTAATLVSVNVTPGNATIAIGGTQPFTAIALYNDGSSGDVTLNIGTVWSSATTSVAANPVNGLATGLAAGTSNITAAYGGKTSPAATLTVSAAVNFGPAGAPPVLGTAAPFGIIAYDAITNSTGPSHIYGDVALTEPGSAGGTIASVTGTGFNDGGSAGSYTSTAVTNSAGVTPAMVTAANNGTPTNIAALPQLLTDLGAAYTDLYNRVAPTTALTTIASAANQPGGTFAAATDLSGYILSPGIYTSPATYGLSQAFGPLVLDAGGNANAVFIIRSTAAASGLTSTTGSVVLQNGAQSKNVFWVMNNLTVGGSTFFQGTVVAGHVITLNTFANVQGRMLAGALGLVSGAITLSGTNIITVPQ